jgi:hypothetical protein
MLWQYHVGECCLAKEEEKDQEEGQKSRSCLVARS